MIDTREIQKYIDRATRLLLKDSPKEAIDLIDYALSKHPGNIVLLERKAYLLSRNNQHETALIYINEAIEKRGPNLATCMTTRAYVYYMILT